MIEAYCEGFGMQGYIFRFVSILGERYTHGHILDFYKQLMRTSRASGCIRRRAAAQVVSVRAGLRGCHAAGHRTRRAAG